MNNETRKRALAIADTLKANIQSFMSVKIKPDNDCLSNWKGKVAEIQSLLQNEVTND
jgi:hypothetical protein